MSKREIVNWLSGSTASLGTSKIIMVLCMSLILAAVIFVTYKITYDGVSYNARFNTGNVIITIITAVIMLMIGSNIAVSLGMVGALSIVRFRTAIKDPHDTIYIFWAIVEGLCAGAGAYKLAILSCLFIAVVLIGMSFYTRVSNRYIIIVRGTDTMSKDAIVEKLSQSFKKVKIRAVNNRESSCEMIFEIAVRGNLNIQAVDELKSVENVRSANWILETGENVG